MLITIAIHTSMLMNNIPLIQLLRLCSPTLPIGSYAYSQGLESACHNHYVTDEKSLLSWVEGLLTHSMQYLDVPVFNRLYCAFQESSAEKVDYWNSVILASRETKELLLEDTQMGGALARLLDNLGIDESKNWKKNCYSLVTMFSLACVKWDIQKESAAHGLIWAWCENQVSIGVKLIPLGQTQGQLLLSHLMPVISTTVKNGLKIEDENIGSSCPGAIIASMQHEEQYTRLFRS